MTPPAHLHVTSPMIFIFAAIPVLVAAVNARLGAFFGDLPRHHPILETWELVVPGVLSRWVPWCPFTPRNQDSGRFSSLDE
jgi:hypothetical protein